jgi:O-antigen/teichoic acid export membrane protein
MTGLARRMMPTPQIQTSDAGPKSSTPSGAPSFPGAFPGANESTEVSRSFVLRGLAALIGGAATLLTTILGRRHLPAEDFTQLIVILSALFVGPLLARFGSGSRVVRDLSTHLSNHAPEKVGETVRSALAETFALSVLFSTLTTLWALTGSNQTVGLAVMVFITLVTESLRLVASDVMAALQHSGWAAALGHQLRTVVSLVLYLLLWGLGYGRTLSAFVGTTCAATVLLFFIGARIVHKKAPAADWPKRVNLRPAMKLGLPFVLVELCLFAMARGDVWFANRFLGQDAAAYATASFLAMQLSIPAGLAGQAASPALARMWAGGNRCGVQALLRKLRIGLGGALTPIAIIAALVAPTILGLYGNQPNGTVRLFVILLAGNLVAATLMLSMNALLMTGHEAAAAKVLGGLLVAYLLGATVAAQRSAVALAILSTLASSLSFVVLTAISTRHLRGQR